MSKRSEMPNSLNKREFPLPAGASVKLAIPMHELRSEVLTKLSRRIMTTSFYFEISQSILDLKHIYQHRIQ